MCINGLAHEVPKTDPDSPASDDDNIVQKGGILQFKPKVADDRVSNNVHIHLVIK